MTYQINNIYVFNTDYETLNFSISQPNPNLASFSNLDNLDTNPNLNDQIPLQPSH